LQENGGKSSAVVGVDEIPCPRLNDGDVEDVSDGDVNSNSVVKIDFARPYLIDTVRITESGNAAESDEISIHFSDGSTQWVSTSKHMTFPEPALSLVCIQFVVNFLKHNCPGVRMRKRNFSMLQFVTVSPVNYSNPYGKFTYDFTHMKFSHVELEHFTCEIFTCVELEHFTCEIISHMWNWNTSHVKTFHM
jgi:hypothetical protein